MKNVSDNYSGPVRLRGTPGHRIAWGKRDAATARAVLDNVREVTPALVIPFHPHQEKIERVLREHKVHAYTLRDLFNLVDRIAPVRTLHRTWRLVEGKEVVDSMATGYANLAEHYRDVQYTPAIPPVGYRWPMTDGEGHVVEVTDANGFVKLAPGENP